MSWDVRAISLVIAAGVTLSLYITGLFNFEQTVVVFLLIFVYGINGIMMTIRETEFGCKK